MRRVRLALGSVLLACALALGLGACLDTSLTATELTADTQLVEEASLAAPDGSATYDFSLDLLRASVSEKPDENVLVSPLSTLSALALAENGADGKTLSQMEQVTGMDVDELTDMLQAQAQLGEKDQGPLSLANSIWLRDTDGLSVKDTFLDDCGGRLGAQVFSAPFDGSTVSDVNAWVGDKTHGMIPSMISEIPDQAQLLLINALAFEGAWEEPFDSESIEPDVFTCEGGTEQDVEMMRSTESTFLENDLATGFAKPYEDYGYAFVGLLPKEGVSVGELVGSLDGAMLRELLTPVYGTRAEIGLPRFTATYESDLSGALAGLGMADAFDPERADFSRVGSSEAGPLYIGEVLHKTYVDVNEEGTRAAAATVVALESGSSAPGGPTETREVILDRPFVYLIVDQLTGMPVFAGTFMGE